MSTRLTNRSIKAIYRDINMSKNINKVNEIKLKTYLEKKKNDTKPNNSKDRKSGIKS